MHDPLIVRQLNCAYSEKSVFENLDLSIKSGECLALLGASGCGKSTLLRSIAGLFKPSAGEIHVAGKMVSGNGVFIPPGQRQIGLVFQDYALFPGLNVEKNIAFGLHGRPENEIGKRTKELIKMVGLVGLENRLPAELSGGQQQRVALARALAPKPGLILLDEPFANVDTALRQQLGESLRDILMLENASAMLVTHDRNDALALSDRLAIMRSSDDGSFIEQIAPPEAVYSKPASRESAKMTGDCFFLKGFSDGIKAETPFGSFSLGVEIKGEVLIIARPEQFELFEDPKGPLTVIKNRFKGSHWEISCGDQKENFSLNSSTPAPKGTRVKIVGKTPLWALSR